jgi:hypothetical protein
MGPFLQVGGQWDIVQGNGFRVAINITQTNDQLSAHATHSGGAVESNSATGFVQGNHFEMTIEWNNGTKGFYTAEFSHGPFTPPPMGFLKGETKDLNHQESHTTWESDGRVFQFA